MKKIILSLISLILLTGCAVKKGPDLHPNASGKTINNMPKWFINPPEKEGFRYNAATATSQDMQMALDKS